MSLDLTKVVGQVGQMVARLKAAGNERGNSLPQALDVLHRQSGELEQLKAKIAASKTSWLVAGLVDRPDRHYKPLPLPEEFTVIATDGSQIEVDRNQSARCYLINIGSITLRYGSTPDAILDSTPYLYINEEDLVIKPGEVGGREQPVEGPLLGIKRAVAECQRLAQLSQELPAGSMTLALLDGSLILWGLTSKDYPDFVSQALLEKGLLIYLEQMRKLNKDRRLAVASYVSYPRSTDVVNTLRVAICPHEPPNCDKYCAMKAQKDCEALAGVQDAHLFTELLGPQERSAIFVSRSSVVQQHYGEHCVHFFYVKADDEIARVEVPQWVAQDENLLNLTHTLVLDQCRRGQGYPVALSEAHEQAVVREADRANFWQLVETLLADEHLPNTTSGKSRSKKTRWL